MILAAYHSDYRGVEAHPATLTYNALECIMAKRYFRSNYAEVNTQFEPPFDNAVCVPLTHGHHALIDAEDYDLIYQECWHSVSINGRIVAARSASGDAMHRAVLRQNNQVDHKNMNPLDNRKTNLRLCSNSQNQANRKVRSDKKHGQYKGAERKAGLWLAQIHKNGKRIRLGYYKTEEEAALAYNKAAIEHYGEFARLNIIGEQTK